MRKSSMAKITESFASKRAAAVAESEKRLFEIHSLIPEIFEIDKKLSMTSVNIMSAAMESEDKDIVQKKIEMLKSENATLRSRRAELLCEKGYPADYTNVKFECPICLDTGFDGVNMCRCMRREVTMAAFEDSGIGELVKRQSFDTFSFEFYTAEEQKYARANFDALKKFAESFDKNTCDSFILMGNTGLGKTHLSTAVAKEVIEKGHKVSYDTVNDIMADFEAQRFRGTVSEEDIRRRYFECDLLIIDDLGCEVSNQFTVSCIYNLVNNRINNRRSTIINTNLSPGELREKYADRITSRIFGEYRPLLFVGKDIRAQKLKK